MKKYTRQTKILELINEKEIETQEELAEELKKAGIKVTQATISRDIKELRLIKVTSKTGKYKYGTIQESQNSISDRLVRIFKNSIITIETSGNLVIIKTIPGAAQICGSAIDSLQFSSIVGSIAGDDTVFIAVKDGEEEVEELKESLYGLIN
ncbi:MAG: arginine repressor [Bacillota bacterium]|nr:arginine repressor [Bacillota bacterium]